MEWLRYVASCTFTTFEISIIALTTFQYRCAKPWWPFFVLPTENAVSCTITLTGKVSFTTPDSFFDLIYGYTAGGIPRPFKVAELTALLFDGWNWLHQYVEQSVQFQLDDGSKMKLSNLICIASNLFLKLT